MTFCEKCGALMRPGDMLCSRCGTVMGSGGDSKKTQGNVAGGGFGKAPGPGAAGGTPIGFSAVGFGDAVKNDLIRKLEKYRNLLAENAELESLIKPQSAYPSSVESDFKKRTLMRYFWPFLVGSILVGTLIYLISLAISVSSVMSIDPSSYSREQAQLQTSHIAGDVYGGYIVGAIVAVGIIVIGVKIARSKRDAFNSNVDFLNMQATERYNQGLKNQKMISMHDENIHLMRQYENLVPEEYRNAIQVGEIIQQLKDNNANTVEEACALID